MKILVIGAGISGLTSARVLHDAGHQVLVVDKGRGVGGRMATRRIEDAVFDHGAQFLTARSGWFTEVVERWLADGVVEPWFGGDATEAHHRYRGVTSMNAIAKYLARELDVRTSTTVASIQRTNNHWDVMVDPTETFSCDACIITAPIPQALALIRSHDLDISTNAMQQLTSITYDPCFAVMATLEGPSRLRERGPFRPLGSESIALISDNQTKGISPVPCITIHSTPGFARRHIDDIEQAQSTLLSDATQHIQSTITSSAIHRWRYAQPSTNFEAPFSVLNDTPFLLLAGDAFGGARIEGAALSGKAAADHILSC